MTTAADVSRPEAWVIAARPQTLPAAIAPVVVGTGLAVAHDVLAIGPAVAALIGAALIQIGTNFANDYYDAVQGVDTPESEGFTRVTAAGLLAPETVRTAMIVTFGAAILVGTYLVYVGGLPILVVGLASVAAGIAYTGGPYPLGYHGFGDLFVFVFFGVIAVTGTYYVQAVTVLADPLPLWMPSHTAPPIAIVVSLPVATLSTAILVVNNVRDLEEDRTAGKRTLAVRLGYTWSRIEFAGLLAVAYLVPPAMYVDGWNATILLPFATLPLAIWLLQTVATHGDTEHLNPALERTGMLLAGYAILFGVGLAL
ncbi:MAG: 1,4-dihydroxy-2-naphthoate polyprenyltransferase [Halobacteriaceae archaeon]